MPLWRPLAEEEEKSLQDVTFNYPYNFIEPPALRLSWTLNDLLGHARFPLARKDACDKWGFSQLTLDNFDAAIDQERIAEPGYASALTVAKLINYALLVAESTSESLPALAGHDRISADLIIGQVRENSANVPSSFSRYSPWHHFFIAVRHPVVRWGINNSMINRWGLPENHSLPVIPAILDVPPLFHARGRP